MENETNTNKANTSASRKATPGPEPVTFFISQHDGSAWGRYSYDRPNKSYGHPSNLPKRASKAMR